MRRILVRVYIVAVTLALIVSLTFDFPGEMIRALSRSEASTAPIKIQGRFFSAEQINNLIPGAAPVPTGNSPYPVYVLAVSTPTRIDGRRVMSVRAYVTNPELSGQKIIHFGSNNYAFYRLQVSDPKNIERVLASTPTFLVTRVALK